MDVYVVLNKNSISLFLDEAVDDLITSLNLLDLYPPELDTCCI